MSRRGAAASGHGPGTRLGHTARAPCPSSGVPFPVRTPATIAGGRTSALTSG
ncbi:hypothetical protein A33M_1203 [Rhodovulum sp. PH10]|nr:hypothetical protein A33M_1203 [Rhodovulum sp. PH10]